MNRNLWLLAGAQGLFLTNNVVFIAINGLVGLSLAPLGWMATLPVMGYVVGGALSTALVARTQARFGRQVSFQIGLLVALASALLCAWAVTERQFWWLVLATVVAGYYSANGQLYRFAAAELCPPTFREKAVSLVMAGGLIGAVLGPNLASRTRGLTEVPFAGAYLALAAVALLSMLLMAGIRFPAVPARKASDDPGRPLSEIVRQPVFIVAGAGAARGYGVLNRLFAAPMAGVTTRLAAGALMLDIERHEVTASGKIVELTATEFKLLRLLLERKGRVQSREELLADVWNYSPDLETRTVDTHVRRLREKLGPSGDVIDTVRGVGYRVNG